MRRFIAKVALAMAMGVTVLGTLLHKKTLPRSIGVEFEDLGSDGARVRTTINGIVVEDRYIDPKRLG